MRRVVAGMTAALLLPAVVVGTGATAGAVDREPTVKKVVREYGDGPVVLAARQGADITFSGQRGDRVTLAVRRIGNPGEQCHGQIHLLDRRGARRAPLGGVLRLRTSGTAVLRFRGRCGTASTPLPARVQLQRVRMHRIAVDGSPARVGVPRRGFVDVAWTRVPADGRVTLTARGTTGGAIQAHQFLVGSTLDRTRARSISVEDGQPVARDGVVKHVEPLDPALERRTVVGLVLPSKGSVGARTAVTHDVVVDGSAVRLLPDRGREHVLTYEVPAGARTYAFTPDTASWKGWDSYALPDEPGAAGSSVHRLVLVADEDAVASQVLDLRIRRIVQAPDLVAGGAPVRFDSADPGQWFVSQVPATSSGAVQLSAGDVAVSGGGWDVEVPGICWSRDCEFTGLYLNEGHQVDDGALVPEAHEVFVRFGPTASGRLSLTLAQR